MTTLIPLYNFNNKLVFISNNSFKQNKSIASVIRKYVNEILNYDNIISIGGEGYLIGLTNSKIKTIMNYTNSKSIYDDANFNNQFYKKIKENNLIDYNKINGIKNSDSLLINLAKLNQNLMMTINKNIYKEIIIINCHHDDFWKKILLLTNYKLTSRKQFLTNNFFVSVSVLKLKETNTFISLGGNCAIAYQLKQLGLRYNSYPFDWCRMSVNKLNNVLENNFEGFSNIQINKFSMCHTIYDDLLLENQGSYIVKNKYNISFAHEIKTDNNEELIKFKETLERRINRFRELKDKKITFIILNQENKEYNIGILIKNLKLYFNNFKLIYLGTNKVKYSGNLSQKDIQNFKYVNIDMEKWIDWKYSNLDWNTIITEN